MGGGQGWVNKPRRLRTLNLLNGAGASGAPAPPALRLRPSPRTTPFEVCVGVWPFLWSVCGYKCFFPVGFFCCLSFAFGIKQNSIAFGVRFMGWGLCQCRPVALTLHVCVCVCVCVCACVSGWLVQCGALSLSRLLCMYVLVAVCLFALAFLSSRVRVYRCVCVSVSCCVGVWNRCSNSMVVIATWRSYTLCCVV